MDGATLGVGFGVGLVVGVLVGWLVAGLRARERAGEAREARARLETALDVNNRSFLELARVHLGQFQQGARSDLEARQTAIDELLRPVRESLQLMDTSLRQVDTGHGALRERV